MAVTFPSVREGGVPPTSLAVLAPAATGPAAPPARVPAAPAAAPPALPAVLLPAVPACPPVVPPDWSVGALWSPRARPLLAARPLLPSPALAANSPFESRVPQAVPARARQARRMGSLDRMS